MPSSYSQVSNRDILGQFNSLTPAVPFLLISPSAEVGGLANIQSVSGQSGLSGIFGNPGLLSQDSSQFGLTASYMPWIREISPHKNYCNIGAFYRISDRQVIGFNGIFLSLGNITFTNTLEEYYLYELATSVSYSYSVTRLFSIGARAKHIYSNLTGGGQVGGVESRPGQAIALDVGVTKSFANNGVKGTHQIGAFIQNIGPKISYSKDSDPDFIPINLRLGYRYDYKISDKSNVFIAYELEKLLIPSPPIYYPDSLTITHDPAIQYGYDPNVSVPLGMIRSFYDAPDGLSEELHEIQHHIALGLKLRQLRINGGYFYEHATKGNNKYFSLGFGCNYHSLRFDACYILPVYKNSYLKNTFQVSLGFVID